MGFKKSEIAKLLVHCHRRCCICHKFCGFKMETHHIKTGDDNIKNAIPLCFECHAEVAFYNPRHPKGRRYSEDELMGHKKQWLEICKNTPGVLVNAPRDKDIGPLEGMILELEFNLGVVKLSDGTFPVERIGCPLKIQQYERAIFEGALTLLSREVKEKIDRAYSVAGQINTYLSMFASIRPEGNAFAELTNKLIVLLRKNKSILENALESLKDFLSHDSDVEPE